MPVAARTHGGALLSRFLIHDGVLVCMDAAGTVLRGDLLIENGAILALGPGVATQAGGPLERFDARGGFVLPGFVQAHLHLCQTLFRGLAEQSDLLRWLRERIWPLEASHTEASMTASVNLGLAELVAGGVTCVNDMGTVRHTDAIGSALEASGVRAVFGKALMDRGEGVPKDLLDAPSTGLDEALALAKRWHGAAGGRLSVSLAPRFILSCSEGLWRDASAAAVERALVLHTHIAEAPSEGREVEASVGRTAARWFAETKVLSPRFVGAHGVWLEDDELATLKSADAALVHCPGSNLKLGSGLADVGRWQGAGLRRGLGSDGAPCNNRLDTFHEMSLAAGISRLCHPEAPLSSRDVLALATCEGARALGLADRVGSLEPGKQADVIVVDASAPSLAPNEMEDPYGTLVHAARTADVRMTMVAGRVLYQDGQWSTLDPQRAAAEARMEARGLVRRAESAGMR